MSIWTLSWPIFIEVFLQLVGNIDQVMMSHYSPQAVAAVANANQILNIFIMLIIVMSNIATTILIAQYLGAKNQSKLSEVCTVSLVLNFCFHLLRPYSLSPVMNGFLHG